jgi:hypothetical protein
MTRSVQRIPAALAVTLLAGALALAPAAFAAAPLVGVPGQTTSVPATTTPVGTTTTPTPVVVPTTTGGSGGLSALQEIGIAVAALALFGGIVYAIRTDARAHAPRQSAIGIDRERGTVPPRAERIRRSRARAKAARRARRAGR